MRDRVHSLLNNNFSPKCNVPTTLILNEHVWKAMIRASLSDLLLLTTFRSAKNDDPGIPEVCPSRGKFQYLNATTSWIVIVFSMIGVKVLRLQRLKNTRTSERIPILHN